MGDIYTLTPETPIEEIAKTWGEWAHAVQELCGFPSRLPEPILRESHHLIDILYGGGWSSEKRSQCMRMAGQYREALREV